MAGKRDISVDVPCAPLQALGEAPLFMYVLHLAIGEYVILPLFGARPLLQFLAIQVVLMVLMIAAAYGLRRVRDRWTSLPLLVRCIMG
ncbi:MAG TPA: hypothetical protein PKY01_07440 [Candidatus Hydrogenedentes bacterium]|nr:hypothetical protein [Candidatus Hydrogenedentota bacterium]